MRYGRRRKKTQRGAHGREEEALALACSGAKSEEQIRTGGQARKEGTGRRMVIGVHVLFYCTISEDDSLVGARYARVVAIVSGWDTNLFLSTSLTA